MTADRYPGYDVLAKRDTVSWNEQTREVIARRLAVPREPRFFGATEWETLRALCRRILPQPAVREQVPLAAYVDQKLVLDRQGGWRMAGMPRHREAWRLGLAALDAEARRAHDGRRFHELLSAEQDALLRRVQEGASDVAEWGGMDCKLFFSERVIPDITHAYYAHPIAWNEIGWGGPAAPRGYVRMDFDRRDPWEASEAKPGQEDKARRENERVGRTWL